MQGKTLSIVCSILSHWIVFFLIYLSSVWIKSQVVMQAQNITVPSDVIPEEVWQAEWPPKYLFIRIPVNINLYGKGELR